MFGINPDFKQDGKEDIRQDLGVCVNAYKDAQRVYESCIDPASGESKLYGVNDLYDFKNMVLEAIRDIISYVKESFTELQTTQEYTDALEILASQNI